MQTRQRGYNFVNVGLQHLRKIRIVKGDVAKQKTQCVVNAANRDLSWGGGVDDAIHRACAPNIHLLREALEQHIDKNKGALADGSAVDTPAFGDMLNNTRSITFFISIVFYFKFELSIFSFMSAF